MPSKFSIIPARALFDTRMTQDDILFLTVLCQYTDRDGRCFPSFDTLSATYSPLVGRKEPYSKASISARMDRLEQFGYVKDEGHRKNALGGYGSKNWHILHDGQIPDEFDREKLNTSVQKTQEKLNTSVQESPTDSERNVPVLTTQKEKEKELPETENGVNFYAEYSVAFGDMAQERSTQALLQVETVEEFPREWVRESFVRTVKRERASGEVWKQRQRVPYALQILNEWKRAGKILPESPPTYPKPREQFNRPTVPRRILAD